MDTKVPNQMSANEKMKKLFYDSMDNSFKSIILGSLIGFSAGLILRKPKFMTFCGAGLAFGWEINKTSKKYQEIATENINLHQMSQIKQNIKEIIKNPNKK